MLSVGVSRKCSAALLVAATLTVSASGGISPGLAGSGKLHIGVRTDAAPFSAQWGREDGYAADQNGNTSFYGYSVELCVDFARTEGLEPVFIPVGTQDRFTKIYATEEKERIDILCGATTATLNVMKYFDVSLYTFLTATSYLVGPNIQMKVGEGPGDIVVGYRQGTTSVPNDKIGQDDLREKFSTLLGTPVSKFKFVPILSHNHAAKLLLGEAITATESIQPNNGGDELRKIDIYIGDRPILVNILKKEFSDTVREIGAAKADEKKLEALEARRRRLAEEVIVSTDVLHVQPYALVLPKCSTHLFALNRFLVTKFRDPAFIKKWKSRLGYDYDAAMEKILEFQSSIPIGDRPAGIENLNCISAVASSSGSRSQ